MSFTIDDLKKAPVWVNWILFGNPENSTEPPSKKPKNPKNLFPAKVSDPATWGTFEQAKENVGKTITHRHYTGKDTFTEHQCGIAGIGFVFTDGLCGIDIDNKKGKPELDKQAETVINLMDTHAERSPSRTGSHLIFRCDMSKIPTVDGKLDGRYYYKNPYNDLECYFAGLTNRFFTYTGDNINDKNIEDRTEQILIFIENYMLKDNFKAKKGGFNNDYNNPPKNKNNPPKNELIDKIRKSKHGYKFSALYDRGDISAYNDDDSAADLALCSILAFWLQGDPTEIDSYFRQSALYRDKWERADYRTATINKAVDGCTGGFYNPKRGRPKKERRADEDVGSDTDNFTDIITIDRTEKYLQDIGISVKYNQITRDTDVSGNISEYDPEHIKNNFLTDAYDKIKMIYKKCPKRDFLDCIAYIASKKRYNPVLELIEGGKWDSVDRLPELYCIMRINPNDTLSQTLIHKWYWQNLSMARNNSGEYGADGMLVLQGLQGIGKTTLASKSALRKEWFGEGLNIDVRNKDTIIEATSVWIGELGEIESTFKSDINALKAFISKMKDTYRVPYAAESDKLYRRTSFIGTCNSDEYLIDETGNRRFWTVPVKEIDLKALSKFDFLQLYLQIDQYAKNDIQGFRLTEDERRQLAERNSRHEKPLKGESEIRDIFYNAENNNAHFVYEEMTVTEFKILYASLKNYSANQIGIALRKHGLMPEDKKVNGKKCSIYRLPRPKDRLDPSDFNNKL